MHGFTDDRFTNVLFGIKELSTCRIALYLQLLQELFSGRQELHRMKNRDKLHKDPSYSAIGIHLASSSSSNYHYFLYLIHHANFSLHSGHHGHQQVRYLYTDPRRVLPNNLTPLIVLVLLPTKLLPVCPTGCRLL